MWDRLNTVTGRLELGFKGLRDFAPPLVALALHSHAGDFGAKNLKFGFLKKSIADRLLGIGKYVSGETGHFMVLHDAARRDTALADSADLRIATPDDAADIEALVNAPLLKTPNLRVCRASILEDRFRPGKFNAILSLEGAKAGFAGATHSQGLGQIDYISLLPGHRKADRFRVLMERTLSELAGDGGKRILIQVPDRDDFLSEQCLGHGFRRDHDLFVNVYDR